MSPAFFLLLGLQGAIASPANCAQSTRAEVVAAVVDAERAFGEARPLRITGAAERARVALPCVGARMLPEEVGGTMRLFAYDAFVQRDLPKARLWLEASRVAEPSYSIPLTVLPEGHPLRLAFDEAAPKDRERVVVRAPKGGTVWVDGHQVDDVALGRPSLVQVVSGQGVYTGLQPDGGAPDDLLPAEASGSSPAFKPVLAVGVSGSLLAAEDVSRVYAGPQVRAHVPLWGVLHAEAVLGLPLTVGAAGAGSTGGVYGLPSVQVGLVGRARGEVVPWGGADLLVLLDDDGPVLGGAVAAGVDVPLGAIRLAPELRASWVGSPLVGVGVGVAFGG